MTPPRSQVPWDISFLRVGALITAAVAVVAAVITGLLLGWADAMAVLVGAAIVTAFFSVSSIVVAWAGRIDDTFTLPAALGTFLVKALILFAFLSALPDDRWLDVRTLAFTVVAGALLWSGIQLRWVWTRQLYYVPPPAPPAGAASASHLDPEKPAPRG
ncbi:hypothetical protein [Blastococcus sp. CT_GayMR16]|uniref:hypothetical protein n=1 Tax=Blastococcus sp. CT_GayMR16 TaxID=2559607 RepID=UPI00107386FA|nr:hypothetical protein [Blastococcus sp. CT_GayMR16]TFV89152.1 hypothetical protein E4P38_08380 [Blastococcus sp. CT_GayMR16]